MTTDPTARTLDVRQIDGPPFDEIVSTLEALEPEQSLRLLAPFEPEPLYEELEARGYSHESEPRDGGIWHVRIEQEA
ncbi:DUF2249 domain-containing protein [Haloarchaeobius amylolyticus]|uniref:DUF2249 domain-containing protein n=1 Tax=Haloarchaeobius amylolyticus TaxID=1198296 RepID=A0ABD6BJW1_9EURY